MKADELIHEYFSTVVREGLFPSEGNLKFHLTTLFNGIVFENKRFLDIGGGSGIYSFYASFMGAREAVCLEPEIEGSSSSESKNFKKLQNLLRRPHVKFEPTTFQAFSGDRKKFDIILLHNSVNHLDETACINLLKDGKCREIYKELFSKMSSLADDGAKLIICDCSRYNFFGLLNVKNPFAPSIEWDKHHAPEIWAELLSEVGFCKPKIRWTSFNRLGSLGELFFGNKYLSYFLQSHYCLMMEKSASMRTNSQGSDIR